MPQVFVYMTAASADEAARIGRALVERRLAACVNVLGPIRSFYWWDGKVQDDAEAALVAKTRAELVPELTAAVKSLHSYSVPCVAALPVADGNPDFLAWIEAETSKP
ncbi:MAG: divalent-cation tolerance protein CutA [Thermodesulfobacteriota bacterium]